MLQPIRITDTSVHSISLPKQILPIEGTKPVTFEATLYPDRLESSQVVMFFNPRGSKFLFLLKMIYMTSQLLGFVIKFL